jgi:hypothetical protein
MSKPTGRPRGRPKSPTGTHPDEWVYKDPIQHVQHMAFLRARAQAKFRNEEWTLTIEEFFKMWGTDRWLSRGRKPTDLVMSRRDLEGPWSKDNAIIIARYEQLCRGMNKRKNIKIDKKFRL